MPALRSDAITGRRPALGLPVTASTSRPRPSATAAAPAIDRWSCSTCTEGGN